MAIIRPFRGLRYDPAVAGDLSKVVAPPYDIIYDEWRDSLYESNPYNIVRLIKTRDEQENTKEIDKYTRARNYIHSWMCNGVLKLEKKPSIYVSSETYEINGETKTRYGFIALIKIENFGNGIHPHERTLSAPMIDRMNLTKATHTNLSQIFSIFTDPGKEIHNILLGLTKEVPDIDFTDGQGIARRMWIVDDVDIIAHLQNIIKEREVIIADGHHRYETALTFKKYMESERKNPEEPFDYVSMYFSSADAPGMTILPTHRKVGGFKTFSEKAFFNELSREFDVRTDKYIWNIYIQRFLHSKTEESDGSEGTGCRCFTQYDYRKKTGNHR